jgi:hypothetical protein
MRLTPEQSDRRTLRVAPLMAIVFLVIAITSALFGQWWVTAFAAAAAVVWLAWWITVFRRRSGKAGDKKV